MSPFDLAAAQPILGQPSKKKWMPAAVFGSSNSMVTNSSDWNIVDGSRSRTEDDVVTIIFFNGTNTDAFDAFDDIEVQGGSAVRGGTGSIPCSFGIDTTYVPPGIITSTSSSSMVKNDTMMIGLVNATAEGIRRLSWKSIDGFGLSYGRMEQMESLVRSIENQEVRKKRMYSAFVSVFILLFFCYIVASFFTSNEADEDGTPDDESSRYVPKFLIPFHSIPN